MRIVPDSTINLYANVRIDNGEQLVFSSVANQLAYFQAALALQQVPCQMVRKTGMLRLDAPANVVSQCNYLSFVNPHFDDKIIYARIIDYDYINNECVEIAYAIDYWQTWMFDVEFEDMYIEREHLSQEDWEKAESNPYDPTIFELRTGETLPISKDLEKLTYEIGTDETTDGYKLGDAIVSQTSVDYDQNGVLIKFAYVDLADLDTVTAGTSQKMIDWLQKIKTTDLGFYVISQEMANYIHSKDATHFPTTDRSWKGSDWTFGGSTLNPELNTTYRPACCYVYDPTGAWSQAGQERMADFFEMMTAYSGGKPENLIIDLRIVPNSMMFLAGRMEVSGALPIGQITAKDLQVGSHKLKRYPFSYMRLISPCGDVKELQYERFSNIQNNEDVCLFSGVLDYSDIPTLILAPNDYKMTGVSADASSANVMEALFFNQFPTMPYTIDAFMAQVAAMANESIANRTVDNAADMASVETSTGTLSQILTVGKSALGAAASIFGSSVGYQEGKAANDKIGTAQMQSSAVGIAGTTVGLASDMYSYGGNLAMAKQKLAAQEERWFGADSALAESDGGVIAAQLNLTRPAYAADKYFPSNGIGTVNFNKIAFCDIVVLRVTLGEDILAVYDNWFKHYGYTSGRCGIPRVINYMQGQTNDNLVPHWETINSEDTTYIKTMDCKIRYSMISVASYIKAMFDSGVRMIKGD